MSRKYVLGLLLIVLCAAGLWSWMSRPWEGWGYDDVENRAVTIERFDRVLDEYVSLGSYTALHRMNAEYPMQTKLLIENVLQLGRIDEPNVERRLRYFYLDSTVQVLLDEVHRQYSDLSDLEDEFHRAFEDLKRQDADFEPPHLYAQISCLNQSIVVADTLLGISLDKYLGADFPVYKNFFSDEQRAQMNRDAIVKDAIEAYLEQFGNSTLSYPR